MVYNILNGDSLAYTFPDTKIEGEVVVDFGKVFREFWNRESIYGFGDTQLRLLYDKVMQSR